MTIPKRTLLETALQLLNTTPAHTETLEPNELFLTAKQFIRFLQIIIPNFTMGYKRTKTLFCIPYRDLPLPIKKIFTPGLNQWFIMIHTSGGKGGRSFAVPFKNLEPYYQHLATHINLTTTYKPPYSAQIATLLRTLQDQYPDIAPKALIAQAKILAPPHLRRYLTLSQLKIKEETP